MKARTLLQTIDNLCASAGRKEYEVDVTVRCLDAEFDIDCIQFETNPVRLFAQPKGGYVLDANDPNVEALARIILKVHKLMSEEDNER